jgi:paraquat-inducible protein B
MGKKANPALIGAFVVGGIALLVVGLMLFGSGQLFKHTGQYVLFFPGAVDGLNVGAPVKFKGVEIGSVKDIRLRFGQEQEGLINAKQVAEGIRVPVIVEIDYDKITGQGGARERASPRGIKALIDLGLRGQLNSQSMVTGLLFVQLNFAPDTPAVFELPPGGDHLPEIPTIPTTMEQVQSSAEAILRKLKDMKLEKVVDAADEALGGISRLVNSPALHATIDGLPAAVANADQALVTARTLLAHLDQRQVLLAEDVKETAQKSQAALEQARETLKTIQVLADPSAPLASQLTASLQEITGAARAVRLLADNLERNPSALVRGKDVSNQ